MHGMMKQRGDCYLFYYSHVSYFDILDMTVMPIQNDQNGCVISRLDFFNEMSKLFGELATLYPRRRVNLYN